MWQQKNGWQRERQDLLQSAAPATEAPAGDAPAAEAPAGDAAH